MKTSNKLLLIATIVIFGYLVVYDFQLKAEYVKGEYKSPFYGMKFTALKNFNTIEHRAGNVLDIRIEKGPKFGIWLDDYFKDKLIITQQNNTLYIEYADKAHFNNRPTGVVIVCPVVSKVIAAPLLSPETPFWSSGKTTINGFNQDTINISAGKSTEIELNKNTLNKLTAGTTASNATLTIHSDNQIKSANFQVLGKSDLKLFNVISNSSYAYTDSATVTLNGKTLRQLQQH